MKFAQPNAVQKRWREQVREMGSVISGGRPCEIHHCAGRTAKHDRVAIGHEFILPLTEAEHRIDVPGWGRRRKQIEKQLFERVLERYALVYRVAPPIADEVIQAIRSYRK